MIKIEVAQNLSQEELTQKIQSLSPSVYDITNEYLISVLDKLSHFWRENGKYFVKALEKVDYFDRQKFASEFIVLSELLSRKQIEQRIEREFLKPQMLDGFYKNLEGDDIYYAPLGRLLHITAGNVFLGGIDSLIMGLITKNINIIKVPKRFSILYEVFFQSLVEADEEKQLKDSILALIWKGGESFVENVLKNNVQGILAWGGEDMAISWKENLPFHVKLMLHGPKIGIQVITKDFFSKYKSLCRNLISDIVTYEQQACSNAQNLFYEEGIDERQLIKMIEEATLDLKQNESLDPNEATELWKDYFMGLYDEFETGRVGFKTKSFQAVFEHSILSPSALNRSLKLKKFKDIDELNKMLSHFRPYLQSCGLGCTILEKSIYRKKLSQVGIFRFSSLGEMTLSKQGVPHDGSYNLVDLTNICIQEKPFELDHFLIEQEDSFYPESSFLGIQDRKIIDSELAGKKSLETTKKIINSTLYPGYVFGTGGTTGNPKYFFYSKEEFDFIGKMLGKSYKSRGVGKNSKIANLFMAGNMWSSFQAIDTALTYCGAIQYPMGGLIEKEQFSFLVKTFEIETLFGLPGIMAQLARNTKGLSIETIFYAGETPSKSMLKLFKDHWGCEKIYSAGYASVDIGPIGYQDNTCSYGEHILFKDLVSLEVIDGEGVVTSKVRSQMPVIRYRTGDLIELLPGDSEMRFRLLGRADKKINIWSSRIHQQELIDAFVSLGIEDFQVIVGESEHEESLKIHISENIDKSHLCKTLLSHCSDLKATHDFEYIYERIFLDQDESVRNKRTGKTSKFLDLREY